MANTRKQEEKTGLKNTKKKSQTYQTKTQILIKTKPNPDQSNSYLTDA